MAKKRKEVSEEEELDFKLPKFDEEKFVKKEKRNIKTLFISFIFAVVIALISFGFWVLLVGSFLRWELVLLVAVVNAVWIRYLFLKLNIDFTDFGRKGWAGSYLIYFFTWLIVFIILVNPPFYDDEPPVVQAVSLPQMQEIGGTVKIVAKIIDNVDVDKKNIDFTITYPDGTNYSPVFTYENNIFIYIYQNNDNLTGEFNYIISAKDNSGHKKEMQGSFSYGDAIKLASPAGATTSPGPLIAYGDSIKFDVKSDVSRVYYKVNGGNEINTTFEGEYYETSPKFKGWIQNSNVTIKTYAEIIYYFDNIDEPFSNTIVDSSLYFFRVGSEGIGEEDSPTIKLPKYKPVQVPGFELMIFIISLVVVAFILKYKKKDN